MKSNLNFRYAKESDTEKILYFIKELAAYEKMLDESGGRRKKLWKNGSLRKQKSRSLRRQSRKRKLILYWHRRLQNSREKKLSKTMSVCRK